MQMRLTGWTSEMVMGMLVVGRIAERIITSGPGRHRDGASDLLSTTSEKKKKGICMRDNDKRR